MAKTVNEAFQTLLGWLTPTATESQKAASHRASIESSLKSHFGMTSFFRTGSFGHGTSISGFSDIDYFAVLPTGRLKANSGTALQELRAVLDRRFPSTGVIVRSPAVVVPFGTSASERHEITPADLVGRTSGGSHIYEIPDRAQAWMRASPNAHNAWVNVAHEKLGYRLKPLIRLLKAWNHYLGVGIRSFYLELRVTERARSETSILYKYDVLYALRHLRARGLAAMQDPMSVSGLVYPCSSAVQESALSKLETAIRRAEKAHEAEEKGNIEDAFFWWDMVYGGAFPKFY